MAKAKQAEQSIDVIRIEQGRISFCVLGTTPLILHRMSQKAMHELLLPGGRKTPAQKQSSLKHNPIAEFKDAPYLDPDASAPTLLQHLASAFKGAMKEAALDLPGCSKAQISRLTWVDGERIGIYGIPKLFMSVTRSSDMNRTPDVRTRAILPQWAAYVSVSFVRPNLRDQGVANLLASAGITQGVGDWRPGKGAGTYGQFELVGADDARFVHLVNHCNRRAQQSAMDSPEPYDAESAEMLSWFSVEAKRRGFEVAA